MRAGKIVYSLEHERTRENFMFMSGESKSVMIRHQLKSAIRKICRSFLSPDLCLQHNNARHHTACHNVQQILDLNLPYLLDLAPCEFHFFWPPKRSSTWTWLHILRAGKKGGAELAATATERLLIPSNSCLSGKFDEMRRTSWRLHWRL